MIDPQIHIDKAIAAIKPVQKSGGQAQAHAQIAIAILLSGLGAELLEVNEHLKKIAERIT